MRSSKSRSRSKANRPRSLGNIINRVFDSSGPEGKVRGTPQQIIEKYLILARDAQPSNDRVAAENFLQHAEHYTRLLSEAQRELAAEQEERQRQHNQGGQGGGQQGGQFQNGNRDRDTWRDRGEGRDYRAEREDDGSGSEVIDLSGNDENLVETPEARPQPQQQPRRDDRNERRDDRRRDDRGERRDDRGDRGERRRDDQGGQPRREDRRDDRGERNERRDDRREPRAAEAPAEPVTHVEPTAGQTEAAPSDAAVADKPKKPRAPRKPKADGGEGGGSQEAAE